VKNAQYGNDNCFEKLIDIYEKYLYKMAFLYVKNEHDALDIYQETVLKAYMNISKLQNPKLFKTWITRILINNIHTRNRHYNKFQDEETEDYIGDFTYSSIEEKLDLYDAIDVLEEKYRTPIILQYFYDLTIEQIADIINCNENTVKTNLRRAKKKMYDVLKEEKNA
jgi:RNA polymerase sigma-70 factor (ECF subfamily)